MTGRVARGVGVKSAAWVADPWDGSQHAYADHVHEQDKPTCSGLLGPDGMPLRYNQVVMGFDLTPRNCRPGGGK